MTNQQPIKPVFRVKDFRLSKFLFKKFYQKKWYKNVECDGRSQKECVFKDMNHQSPLEISIDGVEFHSMEFVREAIELKKLYESKAFLQGVWEPERVCCRKCNPDARVMILCPKCGNKRCPKALNHEHKCTGSNELNQKGVYE